MSINRNLATFAKDVQTDGSLKGIAVTVTVSGGKYVIDGTSQQTMFIPKGVKYRFDVSDSTNSNHPLRFSTTSDGTHNSGSAYTTGVTTSGTAGSAGAYVEVQLQQDAPDLLYYYCGNHSGMGGSAETAPQAVTTYTDSDVDTHLNYSSATSGQVLGYNGSDYAWVDNPTYADSDVDTHLNRSSASSNQILSWNGSDYAWVDDQSGSGGIASVAADTTPELGGDLDVNGNAIVSASNGNIAITPDGSGKIILDGLSFPTSDGSADQVLKTDGSGNLSFVDQSGGGASGGSLTATASGALSDGSTVAINADGTVSVIEAPRTQNIGAQAIFDTTQYTQTPNAVHHIAENKIVIIYPERSTNYLTGVVGTVSGETISFGSKQYLRSANSSSIAAIYDPDNQKIVVAFGDWSDTGHGKSLVVSLASNGTLSVGSLVEHNSQGYNYNHSLAYDTDTNQVLMHYRGGDNKGYVNVGSISNNAMSWGSATYSFNGTCFHNRIVYDPSNQRVVVAFRDDTSTTRIKAAVGTVSGTSITWGSSVVVRNGEGVDLAYDANAQKILLIMQDEVNSTEYLGGFVGTVASTGNTISFGSITHIETNKGNNPNIIYDPTSKKTLVIYQKDASPYNSKYTYATISGTSVSFTTPVDLGSYTKSTGYEPLAYDSTNDRIIFPFQDQDSDNSYDGEALVWRTPTTGGATLTAENFIGISDGAYASGATATIQTAGAVDDAQSGLTAGQTYYVQASDGSLSTSPDTISVVAGTAISATKLLINPDSDPTITTYTDADVNTHLNVSSASANQVLSWNGSDYAWTADNASPSLNATAAGTLANGDMVIVNADGTVSAIGTTTVSDANGTPVVFASTNKTRYHSIVSDPSGKIVIFYQDQGNSEYGTAVVGTISGTSVTFGTPVVFNSGGTSWTDAVYDSNAGKIVCFYLDEADSGKMNAVIGTVSGTSISFSSESNLVTGYPSKIAASYDSNAQKILVTYRQGSSPFNLMGVVCTVSGTSVSAGSSTSISSASGVDRNRVVYDANAQKHVVAYKAESNHGKARVGTISGTSVSFGTEATFLSGSAEYIDVAYHSGEQKTVIAVSDGDVGGRGKIYVATISGTSLSFSSAHTFSNVDINALFIEYDPNAEKLVVSYELASNQYGTAQRISLSGSTFTSESAFTYESGTIGDYPIIAYDSNTKAMIVAYKDEGNSNYGTAAVIQNGYSVTRSLTSENFIGVANAAYTDGQTATIQIAGAVDDAQSGLTAGQSYYVQADGSLGTSPDTIAVMAGTALSATELAINPDTNPSSYTNTQVDTHLNVSSASANQKLSWNGSDYAWTDDSSSPSMTATAAGTLANGDMVIVNADGTVSKIGTESVSAAQGSVTQFESASTYTTAAAFDTNTGKVVLAWEAHGDGNKGKAVVGTISGTSITFGTEVEFAANVESVSIVYHKAAQKMVIVYEDAGASSQCTAIVGTVSGTSITFGSENNFGNACYQTDVSYDDNAEKVVVVYRRTNNNGEAAVGTVSGTSITFGSISTFHSAYTSFPHIVYDQNAQKHVIAYTDDDDPSGFDYGRARVATVSGTSVSFGTEVTWSVGSIDHIALGYDEAAQKILICGVGYNYGISSTVRVGTISGTDITFGAHADAVAGWRSPSIIYDSNLQKCVISGMNDRNSSYAGYHVATISGTDVTLGSITYLQSSSTNDNSLAYDSANGSFVATFYDGSDSNKGKAVVFNTAYSITRALTSENFVGVSDAAYTDGQTATVQVLGAIDDAQSGLTAGQKYFIQSDGSLGLSADTIPVAAGTAISATELLICPEFSAEDKTSPSTQLVASGALSDGTKVCINADGTVSAIQETTASEAIGSETVYNSGSTVLPDAAYDVNSGKVVVVYRDSGDSSKGKAIVGTVSGTSISFGSEVTFHNSAINYPCIAYEANAQKVVIAYHDNSVGKAIVGTVSGTSISFGSAVTWNNAESDYNHISYDSVNQKVVVVCRSTNTTYGTAAVGTVSGTSISFGSTVTFHSGSALYISSAFDVNSGKHVIVWRDGSNSNYGTAKVGTVSGTSISFGSAVVFHSGTTSYMDIAYDASAQKVVIAYNDGSNSNKGAAVVGTVSGTSISFGNEVVFNSSTSFYHGISYHSAAQKVVVGYSNGAAARGELIVGTVSGTSISFGSATTFNNADTNYVLNTYDESAQRIVTVYSDGGNSSHGTAIVFTPAYTSQNLTATNYIGISDAAYTNGQTATIQVAGATDDAQSGLTAGQLYYVQNDGTLSTTADSPSVIAGTAISATKLIVKG